MKVKIKFSDLIWYLIGLLMGRISGSLAEKHFKIRYLYAVASIFLIFSGVFSLYGCKGKEVYEEEIVQAAEVRSEAEDTTFLNVIIENCEDIISSAVNIPDMMSPDKEDPISDFITKLTDIYAEKDSLAVFRCYYPDAIKYSWEVYEEGSWITAEEDEIVSRVDELCRHTSTLILTADKEKKIRCRVSLMSGAPALEEANLYILPQEISNISADAYTAKAGEYVDCLNIPVTVTFTDGKKETITGLNGLYFWEEKEASAERSTTEAGNIKETITTVYTASEYRYTALGEKEGKIHYQDQNIPILFIGEDQTAPEILDLSVSEYQVSNGSDAPDPVTVTFRAEDDISLQSTLEYAFLPEGTEPKEEDWSSEASFSVDITKNGIWTAYCRDESGNIATQEKELLAIDSEAPVVKLAVETATGSWCKENRIIVEAEDASTVQYCYSCTALGIDSGWSSGNTYNVEDNGTWKVKVKDAAGNMTEEEVSINNIDAKPPVILGIKIKDQKEIKTDEN